MTELTYEQRCFQWASRQFLYEPVDDDYFELSEKEQHEHLECRAWQPLEYYDGYKLEQFIDSLAEHIIQKTYPKEDDEEPTDYEMMSAYGTKWHDGL